MKLNYKILNEKSELLERIEALSKEVFPPDELVAPLKISQYFCKNEENSTKMLAFFDNENFVGFSGIFEYENLIYLGFLAIEPRLQNKGYGSKILKELKETFADKILVLEIEKIDENAENNAERIKRAKFYEKAGFFDSLHSISYLGITYEIYSNALNFKPDAFRKMFNDFSQKSNFSFILE